MRSAPFLAETTKPPKTPSPRFNLFRRGRNKISPLPKGEEIVWDHDDVVVLPSPRDGRGSQGSTLTDASSRSNGESTSILSDESFARQYGRSRFQGRTTDDLFVECLDDFDETEIMEDWREL